MSNDSVVPLREKRALVMFCIWTAVNACKLMTFVVGRQTNFVGDSVEDLAHVIELGQ